MELNKEKNFISAVVYLYNDENNIVHFIQQIHRILSEHFLKHEIIIVNDKSTDNGVSLIRECTQSLESPSITVLNMSYHQGMEIAMNAGVDLAIGDFVYEFDTATMDYLPEIILDIYNHALKGYDIVNASSNQADRFTSQIFYRLMNRYAHFQYNLQSDTLRILSRRAINRIRSISKIVPYRKAAYANCGLRMATLSYEPVMKLDKKKQSGRLDLALNSIILFTDIAFTVSVYLALLMAIATLAVGLYALAYHFIGNAVEGWTTTILFLSFSFCGLFVILSMVLKYLSLLLQINYMKNTYVFESIESV